MGERNKNLGFYRAKVWRLTCQEQVPKHWAVVREIVPEKAGTNAGFWPG